MGSLTRLRLFVFLGACLLFGVEPLTGRLVLADYGGSFFVWATCLMFFQGALLLGYLYCHLLAGRLGGKHLALLILPLVVLPLAVTPDPRPDAPIGSLLIDLALGVGLPFLALATTGVVAQQWLARSDLPERDDPYLLYGPSNLGSLLALLAYPLVIEPLLGLRIQRGAWSVGYLLYLGLAFWTWRGLRRRTPGSAPSAPSAAATPEPAAPTVEAPSAAPPTWRDYVTWFLLAAIPSAFLLAVTNVISIDVGSMPLIWVLPLSIYLMSFVLVFGRRAIFPKLVRRFWPEVCAIGLMFFVLDHKSATWWVAGLAHLAALLAVAWVCHGELHRSRPPPRFLSGFYLLLALGGWVGGLFVTVVAPRLFDHMLEYPLCLVAMGLTLLVARWGAFRSWMRQESILLIMASAAVVSLCVWKVVQDQTRKNRPRIAFTYRNVYGQYRIAEPFGNEAVRYRRFYSGTTEHGRQALEDRYRRLAVGYYHRDTPLGEVLDAAPRPRTVGIVGLGAGVVAAHFQRGEVVDYFELDPDVERMAREWFTYLADCKERGVQLRVIPGDARVSLRSVPDGRYDVLVIDAFSSDAIPVHLLTQEALAAFAAKLKPRGRLIYHTSSRFYDLDRVLASTLEQVPQLHGAFKLRNVKTDFENPTDYFLFTRSAQDLAEFRLGRKGWTDPQNRAPIRPWTDDYANPLGVLLSFR